MTRITEDTACAIEGVTFRPLTAFGDSRGWLVELFRADEIPADCLPLMGYASQTMPGVARGPHEHREQTDCFAFIGPGDFRLYLWDARSDSPSFGRKQSLVVGQSCPMTVIIPPGVVHAYRNISDVPALVFNAPNRLYAGSGRRHPVDEIRHEDRFDSPYRLDD